MTMEEGEEKEVEKKKTKGYIGHGSYCRLDFTVYFIFSLLLMVATTMHGQLVAMFGQ